ncbi:hypothetical protein MKW92_036431 [Papaver armeniacum]|nr:hypothetical protein MKW92_036431 [Papaver armeniacum]
MGAQNLILICQYGGKFVLEKDGSLSYNGGEAHAVDINLETCFDDLKLEISDTCSIDFESITMKYFLPSNKRTLITLANDRDLRRMMHFHDTSATADVFVVEKEIVIQPKPKTPINRESRATNNVVGTTTITPSATQIVGTAPDVADSPIAPTGNTVIDLAAASPSTSDAVALDPRTSRGKDGGVAGFSSVADFVADGVAKKTGRTASWRFGAKGFTIVSIADDAEKQVPAGTKWNNPDTVSSGDDDHGEHFPSESSDHDNQSNHTDYVTDDFVEGRHKLIDSWKNGITGVGQEFKNVHDFRDILRKYAISNRFVYRYKKNDTDRVSARCKVDGCSWRIHASWVQAKVSFRIKKFENFHTCDDSSPAHHPQATKNWLATLVKEMLQESPHYKPKEIVTAICQDFGIELNYSQAWRGMEIAREQLQGSYKDAYNQFPWYCEKVMETNPGSFANLTTKDDQNFHRLFISFHATIQGFENGCRPLIFLDAMYVKSKYLETMLVATAVDANDDAFPIAFAMVDVEDFDNWHWFLEQLKSTILTSRSVTFVSDKAKGLSEKVLKVFENARHGYCIHRLVEKFKKCSKGPFHGAGKGSLPINFMAAAQALRLEGFRKYTEDIKTVSQEAYDWIMSSEPQFWANSQFEGEQFNHISASVVHLFRDWISEVRELPIVHKIDAIRIKMMELINTRRMDSSKCISKLTPSKEEKLKEESTKAKRLKVLFSSDSIFEVHDDFINVVNMDKQECSCRKWKVTGLPCSHAIAVFNSTSRNQYDFCSRYFTGEMLQLTYSESINPLPEIEKPASSEMSDKVQVNPPCTRSRNRTSEPSEPGRPKRQRRNFNQDAVKRPLHCTICKGEGHNKASCKATE